jgi:hypothetical protein
MDMTLEAMAAHQHTGAVADGHGGGPAADTSHGGGGC